MPEVSQRGTVMPASPIRRLVPLANKAIARGTKVYRLNIGQPDIPTPPEGLEALKHIDRQVLEYSPSEGLLSLREKLREYYKRYNIDVDVDDIIVTTGGSEAVLFAFMACLDPGDEIIIPEPAYANYMAFAISAFHLPGIEEQVVLIDSVSKRYNECGIRVGALITKHKELKKNVMKFCQARLSPPLLGQIVAEASIDTPPGYMLATYNEYVERRKFLIDELNKIPGCYSPIPMGAFYTVARLPVDDADRFCAWCLEEFEHEGQTIFMAPASGFYTTPGMGKDEVRIAYVLEKEELRKAIDTLRHALIAYPGRTI